MFISQKQLDRLLAFESRTDYRLKFAHLDIEALKTENSKLKGQIELILDHIGAELVYEPGGWKVTKKA